MTSGQLFGRYRIVGKIGDGGVGSVHQAVDTRLGRMVALKFLHDRWRDSRAVRARFRREALIAASLNHPNICTVYDLEESEGRIFIVMELLRGCALSHWVEAGAIGVDDVVDVGRQVANALIGAHGNGVVHRDVKPANVFVGDDGVVKLLDFGVAKPVEARRRRADADGATDPGGDTANGRLVGTVGYMSPEQTRGDTVDGRSDVFSLGVVLYEAATGVRPFDATTSSGVFDLVFSFDPPPPSCLNARLPKGFNRVVRRALSKRPADRYATAAEMLHELDGLRRGDETGGSRVPTLFRALRAATLAHSA